MQNKIFQNKVLWAVVAIMAVGAFLRAYHFGDWMHYQLDQARDFRVIHAAMEYGPGELPLQGPRAAGSFLRLGPLLYYLEYFSALIFGDTPVGSVVIILLLNIAVIPIFYLFIRQFFRQKISLGLSSLFAVSLFMIIYSRFGWNPNLLPFFMTAFFYSVLRATGQGKRQGPWLVASAVALAFVTNMHFIALVITPMIAFIYVVWVRPKISLKWWIIAIAFFFFLNIPLIINDIKTNGENFKEFVSALMDRSGDEKSKHNIIAKGIKNVGVHAQYNWIILTGHQLAGLPEWYGGSVACRYDCRKGIGQGLISLIMIILGISSWFLLYRREKNEIKKNFLRLTAIWAVMTFVIFTPLAYDIAPRFFLLNAPLIFVLFGFSLTILLKKIKIKGALIVGLILLICILSNVFFVARHFKELSQSSKDKNFILTYNDRILKEKTRITLGQIEKVVDWMEEHQSANKYPVFVHAQSEYQRVFLGRLRARNIQRGSIPDKLDKLYRQGNYFVILRTQSDQDKALNKFKKTLKIVREKNFGTLTAYYLQPKESFITADKKNIKKEEHKDRAFSSAVQPRYLWRQIFSGCTYDKESGICKNK